MGWKAIDVTPIQAQISATTPVGKNIEGVIVQCLRSNTVSLLRQVLPADASIFKITYLRSVASDAATTATVTINIADQTGTISTGVVGR